MFLVLERSGFYLYSIIFCYDVVFLLLKNGFSRGINVNVDHNYGCIWYMYVMAYLVSQNIVHVKRSFLVDVIILCSLINNIANNMNMVIASLCFVTSWLRCILLS
jgi:hypothetical protein